MARHADEDCGSLALGRFSGHRKDCDSKLFQLHAARTLHDLHAPGNSLEALKDDRTGQHSIRINNRYRLCFIWENGDADLVEITEYH
jgi:proteic killer suppression protein